MQKLLIFIIFVTQVKLIFSSQVTCGSSTCSLGSYCANAQFNSCAACPAGTELTAANVADSAKSGISKCTACGAGKTSPSGSTSCSVCPAGKYTEDSTFNSAVFAYVRLCTNCPIGKHNDDAGTPSTEDHDDPNDCVNCLGGTTAVAGSTSCTICDSGKYRLATAVGGACLDCPMGSYLADAATDREEHILLSQCLACAAGQFNGVTTGVASCDDCPVGKYNDDPASSPSQHETCQNCPTGKSHTQQGAQTNSTCVFCTQGKHVSTVSNICVSCLKGSFNPSSGPLSGQGICHTCPGGWFNSQPGVYVATTAGTYDTDDLRAALHLSCTACNAGRYLTASSDRTNHDNILDCKICPAGYTSDNGVGSGACAICSAGTYATHSTTAGVYPCTVCPSGRFLEDQATLAVQHDALADCLKCAKGKSLSDNGNSAAAHISSSQCLNCTVGKYGDQIGLQYCKNCGLGRAHNTVGQDEATDCIQCAPTRYQNLYGMYLVLLFSLNVEVMVIMFKYPPPSNFISFIILCTFSAQKDNHNVRCVQRATYNHQQVNRPVVRVVQEK
jgi:hypothetical protein